MRTGVRDEKASEIMGRLSEALADLAALDLAGRDKVELLKRTNMCAIRLASVQNTQLDAIDRAGTYRPDGFRSAKALDGFVCGLSNYETRRRAQTVRAMRALPEIAGVFAVAGIGVGQVGLIAEVYANKRVADEMAAMQDTFLVWSILPFREFRLKVREWERLTDQDGPEPANERNHRNRNIKLLQDHFDLGWNLEGSFGAAQGAFAREIFDHYIHAEWLVDWEQAKALFGDKACTADMARTEAQRRADAFIKMISDAAGSDGSAVPKGFVHTIVWSAETFEEMLSRFAGNPAQPHDPNTYKCETVDGTKLEPTEAFTNALANKVRRAVVNAQSVHIDLGEARLFTGSARAIVQLTSTTCVWPGCGVPTTRCEIDHIHDHAKSGRTCPDNGGILCGNHNRFKQNGFRVRRDDNGAWHIHRPNGTEIAW